MEKGVLCTLAAMGVSQRQIGSLLKCHHGTVNRLLHEDAEIKAMAPYVRLTLSLTPLLSLVRESRKSWRAAAWLTEYYERRFGTESDANMLLSLLEEMACTQAERIAICDRVNRTGSP